MDQRLSPQRLGSTRHGREVEEEGEEEEEEQVQKKQVEVVVVVGEEEEQQQQEATSTVRVAPYPANRQKEAGLRVWGDPHRDFFLIFLFFSPKLTRFDMILK